MSVVTQIEEAGPCRLKVTIEVPAPAVEAEIGRVVQDFRRQARLPGFRPGKVPMGVIKKRFKDDIKNEVVERLLPRYWKQAQSEKDLDPLLPPTVEDLKFEEGEAMTVVAAVETRPEIELGDLDSFDLPEENADATEPEIDEAIADLRKSMAKWNVVERAAAQGDLVVGTAVRHVLDDESETAGESAEDEASDADGDAEEAGEEEGPQSRPIQVEIGGKNVDEELSLLLTGKKAGQSANFETEENRDDEKIKVRYDIEVVEVKEQELPEVDDEFASQIGPFETAAELRERVAENIGAKKDQDLARRRREALLDQLRERHPVTLPEGVVQRETETMMQEFVDHLAQQGVDVENAGMDFAKMADDMRPNAEKRVHARLLLDAVAKEKMIRLDESRFEEFLGAIAAQQGTHSMAVRQSLAEDGRLESLRAQMLRDQTLAHLLGDDVEEAADDDADGDAQDDDGDDADGASEEE